MEQSEFACRTMAAHPGRERSMAVSQTSRAPGRGESKSFGVALLFLLLALFAARVDAATHVWSGAGGTPFWSNPANWASGGAPTAAETDVHLVFPPAGTTNAIHDVTGLKLKSLTVQRADMVIGGFPNAPLTLDSLYTQFTFSDAGGAHIILQASNTTFSAGLVIVVSNFCDIIMGTTNVFPGSTRYPACLMQAQLIGNGSLMIIGAEEFDVQFNRLTGGTLTLAGDAGAAYPGPTGVYEDIRLNLARTGGPAIAGKLVAIGDVVSYGHNQVASNAMIDLRDGVWDLNSYNQTIGALELASYDRHARIETGPGQLTLDGYVYGRGKLIGNINLGGSQVANTRTFNVPTDSEIEIQGVVSGPFNTKLVKSGGGYLTMSGNNTYDGLTEVMDGYVEILSANALGSTNGATLLHNSAVVVVSTTNATIGEPLTVTGGDAFTWLSTPSNRTNTWAGPVQIDDGFLNVGTDGFPSSAMLLTFSGPLSGNGEMRLTATPNYVFSLEGDNDNTLASIRVDSTNLRLNKPPGRDAIGALLTVTTAGEARLLQNDQIADTANVSLDGGLFNVNNRVDGIRHLLFDGGSVSTSLGQLTIHGDILSAFGGNISGKLRFSDGVYQVQVNGGTLSIAAEISSQVVGSTMVKSGSGQLDLDSANIFSSTLQINAGTVRALNPAAFGDYTAGIVIQPAGKLLIDSGLTISGEFVQLNGGTLAVASSAGWNGNVILNSNSVIHVPDAGGQFNLAGQISGAAGFTKTGPGKLQLQGAAANTFTGTAIAAEGEMLLTKTNGAAISGNLVIGTATNAATVRVLRTGQMNNTGNATGAHTGSLLEVATNSLLSIQSFNGNGTIQLPGTASFMLGQSGAGDSAIAATITGGGSLYKYGTGTLSLFAASTYLGSSYIVAGTCEVVGSAASSAFEVYPGATLKGNGQTGPVFGRGNLAPGASPGQLRTGHLTLTNSGHYLCEIAGTAAGEFDQLKVSGAVNLNNAILDVLFSMRGGMSNSFTIIDNDGVDAVLGTFAGLAQNSIFAANGKSFRINYAGGTGNDVVLTRVNATPSLIAPVLTPAVNEGGTVHLTGTISDADTDDTFTLALNWGDGSQHTVNLPAGTTTIDVTHTYADDKPNGQPNDSFTVQYTLTDASGSSVTGSLNTVVSNVAPAIAPNQVALLQAGQPLSQSIAFTDPGADTWTATVNYGDGNGAQPLVVGPGKTLPLNHAFPTNGIYTVALTVSDDDTGMAAATLTVFVGLELKMTKTGAQQATLSWPGVFENYVPYRATSVNSSNWTEVPGARSLVGGEWKQVISTTNAMEFFRLGESNVQ